MKRDNLKSNWPIPDEYMVELGRVSTLYGVLENVVNIAISKLAGYSGIYDYRSAIMLAHANFQQRVDILATLFEQTVGEYPQLEGYKEVIKLIKRAQKSRNKFMHGSFGCDPDSGRVQLSVISARGSLQTKVEIVHIKELIEISAVMHEAACALQTIITGNEIRPIWDR